MDYIEVRFFNDTSLNEAIIAWLGENEFDMFEEREDGLNAYIDSKMFDKINLEQILSSIPDAKKNIRYESSLIKDQNWNTKWESNFEPVNVAGKVYIRAPFHEPLNGVQYEIIIEPKMSFGTGHHATTTLMVTLMLEMDFRKKKVLDMGCGTGVLAILAEKAGAEEITAIDINEWAFSNCLENCQKNNSKKIKVIEGNVEKISNETFDIILANINRNVLLEDIPFYSKALSKGGSILISGILSEDKNIIDERCNESGLHFHNQAGKDNWLAIHYKK